MTNDKMTNDKATEDFFSPQPSAPGFRPGTRLSAQVVEDLINIGFDFGIEFNGFG